MNKTPEPVEFQEIDPEKQYAIKPSAIITMPGQYSDRVKIWQTICNTVAGCTFIVSAAWVITSLWGH